MSIDMVLATTRILAAPLGRAKAIACLSIVSSAAKLVIHQKLRWLRGRNSKLIHIRLIETGTRAISVERGLLGEIWSANETICSTVNCSNQCGLRQAIDDLLTGGA